MYLVKRPHFTKNPKTQKALLSERKMICGRPQGLSVARPKGREILILLLFVIKESHWNNFNSKGEHCLFTP